MDHWACRFCGRTYYTEMAQLLCEIECRLDMLSKKVSQPKIKQQEEAVIIIEVSL